MPRDRGLEHFAGLVGDCACIPLVVAADQRIDDDGESVGDGGVRQHRFDVRPHVRAGDGWGEVGGVRQRRHFVAKERAGTDSTDGPVIRDAEGITDAEHGEPDRAERTPRCASGQRHNGGKDAGGWQEDTWADDVEAEFQHGLHRTGSDGCSNHHADAEDDDGSWQRDFHHAVHILFHLRPFAPFQRHENAGDADTDNQRDVRSVILEDKELHHEDGDGDGQRRDFKAERIVAAVFVLTEQHKHSRLMFTCILL